MTFTFIVVTHINILLNSKKKNYKRTYKLLVLKHNKKVTAISYLAISICTTLMTLAVAYVGALYEIASDHVFSGGYANIIKPIHTLVWIICLVVFYHLIRSTIHMDVMLLLSNPKNKVFREKNTKLKSSVLLVFQRCFLLSRSHQHVKLNNKV